MTARRTSTSENKVTQKQKRKLQRQIWTDNPGLDVVHPDAAGIDVGNSEHYVAIAPEKSDEPVQRFGCFTSDLRNLARVLKAHGIRSVAMQSTGVYWIPLYDVLEEEGFEVYLVNARDTRNLPGRKSDVQESQWLLKLHTYGSVAELVPSDVGDPHIADVLETAGGTRAGGKRVRESHAEVPDADEPAAGECYHRHYGADRTEDSALHPDRRTES